MTEEEKKILNEGHAIIKDGIVYDIDTKIYMAEEYEACMKAMDEEGVPRIVNGHELSIWGRAKRVNRGRR